MTTNRTCWVQTHEVNSSFSCKHCENMLQQGSFLDRNLYSFIFLAYFLTWSFLFAIKNTLLGNFSGDKHPYCTKLLQNVSVNFDNVAKLFMFINSCQLSLIGKVLLSIFWYNKTFFLPFMGAGSSFWHENTIVLFLLLLKWDYRFLQGTTSFLMLLHGYTL